MEGAKSNEEIIEELTKDLESSCLKVDYDPSKDKDQPHDDSTEDKSKDNESQESESIKQNDSEERIKKIPEDFVDEEFLKDLELRLSQSEKEELREEARTIKEEGNQLFKSGSYLEAITVYTRGLQKCPLSYPMERSILYSNRAAAKSKCSDKESAITDCTKAVELNSSYVKAYARRAQLYEETEKLDEALEDFKKVLTFDPGHTEANHAIRRLPELIAERNKKLTKEMLAKLKDLGNVVLNPFGLSTDNFELQKDPNSGGYSVKFHQNPS